MYDVNKIPRLGVGFSAEVDFANPIYERVHQAEAGVFDYFGFSVEYQDQSTFDQHYTSLVQRFPLLFHTIDLNVCEDAPLPGDIMGGVKELTVKSNTPWVTSDMAIWRRNGENMSASLIPGILTQESCDVVAARIKEIYNELPVPFLPENAPYWFSFGDMHILDFMAELVRKTDCYLCLDIGHLYSYQLLNKLDPLHGLENFPLDRVLEMHMAGGIIWRRGDEAVYEDAHFAPVLPEVWAMYETLVSKATNLKAVTLEAEGMSPDVILSTVKRLKSIWNVSTTPQMTR